MKYLCLVIIIFVLVCCKKNDLETKELESITQTSNSRLKFNSTDQFTSLMSQLSSIEEVKLDAFVKEYTNKGDFISYKNSSRFKSVSKKSQYNVSEDEIEGLDDMGVEEEGGDEFIELVPDPFFASVLDEKMEIEVDGQIYKITEFGTFITSPSKYNKLLQLLTENQSYNFDNVQEHEFYSSRIDGDLYFIEEGITLLDTYKRVDGPEGFDEVIDIEYYEPLDITHNPSSNFVNGASSYSNTGTAHGYYPNSPFDNSVYNNIPTVIYGAKTLAGKFFEALRGREEIYTANFEKKRRVRISFYNATWGVYSSVGVSVKMQKKNWIGWSGTNANELRLGWDFLEYYVGDLPSGIGNLNTPVLPVYNPVDLPYVTKKYVEVDLLGYNLKFDQNKEIQVAIKELYDNMPKVVPALKPKEGNINYAYKVWSDFTKKSISIIQERDEIVAYNSESLTKVFDWSVGLKLNISNYSDVSVDYEPLEFNLNKVSVYGLARYGSSWKGARIQTKSL